jgi:hypothetical protein
MAARMIPGNRGRRASGDSPVSSSTAFAEVTNQAVVEPQQKPVQDSLAPQPPGAFDKPDG